MTDTPTPSFGRLERLELREAWPREDTYFTPWLAREENLQLLGETIGLDLELQGTEESVGAFSADIVCKVVGEETLVLIENQIERTDHTHLGQVITYAAGLEAVTIVWIAKQFADPHRAAVDWLNQISHEGIRFFGLEVELWKIGDSPIAPKFNIVAKPNDWSRTVREATSGGSSSEHPAFRREFWAGFLEHLRESNSTISCQRTPSRQPWMTWSLGRTEVHLGASVGFRDGYLDAALVSRDRGIYRELKHRQPELDKALGEPLTWDYSEQRIQNYARLRRTDIDPMNRHAWEDAWRWLELKLSALDRVFRPRLAALPVTSDGEES